MVGNPNLDPQNQSQGANDHDRPVKLELKHEPVSPPPNIELTPGLITNLNSFPDERSLFCPPGKQSSTTNVGSAAPRNPKKQWLQDATATRTSKGVGPSAEPEIEEVPRNGRIKDLY